MLVQAGKPLVQKYEGTKINKLSKETILYLTFLCYFSPFGFKLCAAKRYLVISPTSDLANVTFANVLGHIAKAKSRFANVLLVTSPMY